jgi:hypothetical protein
MAKALLLIDVDGPLNPYAGISCPAGYETHRLTPRGCEAPLNVRLNPAHGPMLLALADTCELTWCTAWREQANEFIGPLIGLPRLPVVPLTGRNVPLHGIWKRSDVEKYAADRPLAWFDDDFEQADLEWADKRTADGVPTLLLTISARLGIVQADVDRAADWARSFAAEVEA